MIKINTSTVFTNGFDIHRGHVLIRGKFTVGVYQLNMFTPFRETAILHASYLEKKKLECRAR